MIGFQDGLLIGSEGFHWLYRGGTAGRQNRGQDSDEKNGEGREDENGWVEHVYLKDKRTQKARGKERSHQSHSATVKAESET